MSDRPQMPNRLPMKGDGSIEKWTAWRDACLACRFGDKALGCVRTGVVENAAGQRWGLPMCPGGCTSWTDREAGIPHSPMVGEAGSQ